MRTKRYIALEPDEVTTLEEGRKTANRVNFVIVAIVYY